MIGVYNFYALQLHRIPPDAKQVDYFLGSIVGDKNNDEDFASRFKRVSDKVVRIYGWGNWSLHWAQFHIKEPKILSLEERYKRAVTRTYNQHKKRVQEIIQSNSLFVDDEIDAESKNLYARIDALKKRYHEPDVKMIKQENYKKNYQSQVADWNSKNKK